MEEIKQDTQGLAGSLVYTVHMLPWENAPAEEPLLSRLLREFGETSRKQKGREKALENGMQVTTVYRMRRGDFFMEKKSGGRVLLRSERESYGWSLTKWDFSGRVTERIRLSPEFIWMQSAYFKDGNGKEPVAFVLPAEKGLAFLERTQQGWRKSALELVPAETSAKGSILKDRAGEPVCSVWSGRGLFWAFRPEAFRKCREAGEKLLTGEISEEPQWPREVLPEERLPELEQFLAECSGSPAGSQEPVFAGADDYAADHSLRDFAEPAGETDAAPVLPAEPATKYAVAARSLSGVVSAPGLPQKREEEAARPEEVSAAVEERGPEVTPSSELKGSGEDSPASDEAKREETGVSFEGETGGREDALPPAEKPADGAETQEPEAPEIPVPGRNSGEQKASLRQEGRGEKEDFLPEGMEEFREFFRQIPDKLIAGSDGQMYAYFGEMKGSLRHGDGRTAMAGGHTAYEGGFREDKKDGFGVYYYKSGRLCYAGNWKGNRRQGAGVSFSPQEGTMFAGSWRENRPEGMGALFDEDGELLYAGQWKNGKRHGRGTEYRRGEIVFSGFWENGEPVVDGIGGGR